MSTPDPSTDRESPVASKRLVVISYHFPPDGAVGGLRWAGLTRGLADLGWSSWVVTAAMGTSPEKPGVTVIRVPRRTILNDRYMAWRQGSSPEPPTAPTPIRMPEPGKPIVATPSARGVLRSSAGLLLSLPDVGRGWMTRAAATARALIREVKPSVLVTSGPPHSQHLAGRLAVLGTGVKRFVDLRDPIQTSHFIETHPVRKLMIPRLEHASLASADRVLCVTAEVAADIARRFPGVPTSHVPNGVDLSALPERATESELLPGLVIAHVGTLYLGRDPAVALRALRLFFERHPDARATTKLCLAGATDGGFGERVNAVARENGLEDRVEQTGMLPRAQALDLLRRARVTLVFAQGQAVQVPAKLYEAAAMGYNVIVITEPGSPSATDARKVGLAVISPDDHIGLAGLFERAWLGENITPRDSTTLAEIDHRTIAKRLSRILDG